jgi:DNA-directed RNA polymerase subunit M/transcription elongation factor TFIIS
MHFCQECQNMYYIRLDADDSNKLIYYCRKCGHEDTNLTSENICVTKTNFKQADQSFTHIINEYTKLDPTLPRFNNVLCPNADCSTNTKDTPREIIYIRYNEQHMSYIYLCTTCDTTWKTDNEQ